MKMIDSIKNKWQAFRQDVKKNKSSGEGSLFKMICMWVYKLRSVFLAIPVAFAAILLAIQNAVGLPASLSLFFPTITSNGLVIELITIDRFVAVFVPLVITAVCLILVFCSKRISFPWLVSVFSLLLPLFFYFTSIFPG